MDSIQPLVTITATAKGGRNGHTESSDGIVKADLSVPKEMGGPGKPGTATPEHLFAAGYAACFGGALDFVAKQHKKDASKAAVTCAVSIGPRDGGGFGLAVKMHVEDKSVPQADLDALVRKLTRRSARTRTPHGTTCRSILKWSAAENTSSTCRPKRIHLPLTFRWASLFFRPMA
jgi:Ohr subfamily peroxiredoxin